jgi:hypothetical protein
VSIVKTQSVTGNGATLVLNGVVAGNALIYASAYSRSTSTGVAEAAPTDSGGTFIASSNDSPILLVGQDVGASIFHEQNTAAGTHTVTPQANTIHNCSLTEFSGLLTSGMSDAANHSSNVIGSQTSQDTGATQSPLQADELEVIALAILQTTGGNPIGLTDPVAGTTTLQINQNTATDLGVQQSYKVLYSIGPKSETFNWTTVDATTASYGCIATFMSTEPGSGIGSSNLAFGAGRYIGWIV